MSQPSAQSRSHRPVLLPVPASRSALPLLSVIIPTLNEAPTLRRTLEWARRAANGAPVEFIVSDCSSSDATLELAARLDARVVTASANRADALNRGASVAEGPNLLFLHADSLPPLDYPALIHHALARPGAVGGAFDFKFDRQGLRSAYHRQALKLVVVCNRIRFRWTRNFYGDQGIFVPRHLFHSLGGFPQTPLMEDLRFCQRLNRAGRTVIVNAPMKTSPRRFVSRGVLRQFFQDLLLMSCESFGLSPEPLWHRYNSLNRNGHNGQPNNVSPDSPPSVT